MSRKASKPAAAKSGDGWTKTQPTPLDLAVELREEYGTACDDPGCMEGLAWKLEALAACARNAGMLASRKPFGPLSRN